MSSGRGPARAVDTTRIRMPVALTTAYEVPAGSRVVFFSGLTAKDAEGVTVAPGDAAAQAEHILDGIEDTLGQIGGSLENVIKLTVYLQDRTHGPAVGRVRGQRFSSGPPPASTMVVAQLMSDDQLVEIEAIAALPA